MVSTEIVRLMDATLTLIVEGYGPRAAILISIFLTRFQPRMHVLAWNQLMTLREWCEE